MSFAAHAMKGDIVIELTAAQRNSMAHTLYDAKNYGKRKFWVPIHFMGNQIGTILDKDKSIETANAIVDLNNKPLCLRSDPKQFENLSKVFKEGYAFNQANEIGRGYYWEKPSDPIGTYLKIRRDKDTGKRKVLFYPRATLFYPTEELAIGEYAGFDEC